MLTLTVASYLCLTRCFIVLTLFVWKEGSRREIVSISDDLLCYNGFQFLGVIVSISVMLSR